jgi:predicted nucleic acid-binding protein
VRYLVDADWLIDALAGRRSEVQTLDRLSEDGLAVSIIAVAEIYEGAFGTSNPDATLASYREFLSEYAILPVTDPIVERFARMRSDLRRLGRLIADMDLLIAATAIEEDLVFVTRNQRHFERITELRLFLSG